MARYGRRAWISAAAGLAAAAAGRRLWRMRRALDLRGRVVLITGGSRGLGYALAQEFARRGAKLVLCARDPAELDRAATALEERGAEVLVRPCDVASRAEVEDLVRAAVGSVPSRTSDRERHPPC